MEQKKYWVQSFQATVAIVVATLLYIKFSSFLLFYADPYTWRSYVNSEIFNYIVMMIFLFRITFFPTKGRKSVNAKRSSLSCYY